MFFLNVAFNYFKSFVFDYQNQSIQMKDKKIVKKKGNVFRLAKIAILFNVCH